MTILRLALLGSLRIAFLASLKITLLAYTFFLTDTPHEPKLEGVAHMPWQRPAANPSAGVR